MGRKKGRVKKLINKAREKVRKPIDLHDENSLEEEVKVTVSDAEK